MYFQTQMVNQINKTFVVQNQQTQFSQVLKISINLEDPFFNIEPFLNNKNNQSLIKVKIYDFKSNSYVQLPQMENCYLIPIEYIKKQMSDIVLIKYRFSMSEASSSQTEKSVSFDDQKRPSDTSSMKKQRSKQRIIIQVIQIVKRWRDIHLQVKQNKRVSLLEAAKMVGLPKKSLDDYFYQLRLGQKFGFDFKSHLFDKIGLLRNYLKQNKPKGKSQKTDKHPKNLKIIEQFDQISHLMKSQSRIIQNMSQQIQNNENNNNRDQIFQMEDQDEQSKMILQNRFYEDFQFLLDQPQDPFLSMQGGFRKKKKQDCIFQGQFFF